MIEQNIFIYVFISFKTQCKIYCLYIRFITRHEATTLQRHINRTALYKQTIYKSLLRKLAYKDVRDHTQVSAYIITRICLHCKQINKFVWTYLVSLQHNIKLLQIQKRKHTISYRLCNMYVYGNTSERTAQINLRHQISLISCQRAHTALPADISLVIWRL